MAMVQDSRTEGEYPTAEEQEFTEKELNAVLDRLIQGKTPDDSLARAGW